MIADYVNDQIDVVVQGLSRSLRRLRPLPRPQVRPDLDRGLLRPGRHLLQHPADPGPGARQHPAGARAAPVSGRARQASRRSDAADKRRRAELEQQLPDAADRAYIALLRTAHRRQDRSVSRDGQRIPAPHAGAGKPIAGRAGKTERARRGIAGRVCRLSRQGRGAAVDRPAPDPARRGGRERSPARGSKRPRPSLQHELAALVARKENESARSPTEHEPGTRLSDPPAG